MKSIPRVENDNMTEIELKCSLAEGLLDSGYISFYGGDKLAQWMKNYRQNINDVVCGIDTIYIQPKDKDTMMKLVHLVLSLEIGDEIEFVKYKDSKHWWFSIWWD